MAYFTGTANNPSDLLAKLRVHAESVGWVTDRASATGVALSQRGGILVIQCRGQSVPDGGQYGVRQRAGVERAAR